MFKNLQNFLDGELLPDAAEEYTAAARAYERVAGGDADADADAIAQAMYNIAASTLNSYSLNEVQLLTGSAAASIVSCLLLCAKTLNFLVPHTEHPETLQAMSAVILSSARHIAKLAMVNQSVMAKLAADAGAEYDASGEFTSDRDVFRLTERRESEENAEQSLDDLFDTLTHA